MPQIRAMEWREIEWLLDHWRRHPPAADLIAAYIGFQPPQTVEEQWAAGAMGPEDVLVRLRASGGKIEY